jgi:hypothetical protein
MIAEVTKGPAHSTRPPDRQLLTLLHDLEPFGVAGAVGEASDIRCLPGRQRGDGRTRIGVIGPATTGRLATDSRPHTEIGRELGVGYVVSGGVRLGDSTVFVQAVRVTDGVHVFAFRKRAIGVSVDSLVGALVTGLIGKVGAR